ncbi:MAG: N-acetylmuramoyl-L-alanine amidase [Gammaproteobacteria bacterium]|nr:N-acetylmuramoyl-L-alanine amidase [Gammaproteobacteria bacterium]
MRLIVFGLLLSVAIISSAASIDDVRLWRAPDHTRLVFDLSDPASYELFALDNPHRVVIDIANSELKDDLSDVVLADTPIKRIRSGIRDNTNMRIVIDLNAKIKPAAFTLEPSDELGNRLVVDLYDAETGSINPVTIESPIVPAALDDRRELVIAISAGHGGEDPGSIGYDGRIKEKNVTLAISKNLRDQLNAIPGYRTVMIRDSDYYVELRRRPQIARDQRADLFVAIHADWYRSDRANGVTIYALSGDRADRENARRVAEKENGSDLLGGVGGDLSIDSFDDDVALTLVSLQMSWSMEQSLSAGTSILESLDVVTRLRRDKVQQASFQVLNSPDIPSILIETGYLTNPEEAKRLNSPSFQKTMAQAIAQGIMNYFYKAPPEGTLVAWQKKNGITGGTYTVKSGDSLSEIASGYGMSVASLKSLNGISSDVIQIGQVLKLQGKTSIRISEHTIRSGETLSEIASRYAVSVTKLSAINNLSGDRILIGQVLKIPPQ